MLKDLNKNLHDVKKMRNTVLHNMDQLLNEKNFTDLTTMLFGLIEKADIFYSSSLGPQVPYFPAVDTKQKLNDELEKVENLDKSDIHRCISRLLLSGKEAVGMLWGIKLDYEVLLLGNDKANRQKVFHPLDVMVKEPASEEFLSYTKIFETPENVVVVAGVAGAGKTTLVKNIVLQFFDLQQGTADYLSSFNQLVFFECRDRSIKELSDVIDNHYKDLCSELGKENVLEALLRIDVLFIIDGFDEINDSSKKVVIEIIEKTWRRNCRVLITTRPHALEEKLEPLLKREDVSFTLYEIMQFKKLEDQLAFLRRYEAFLCAPIGEMTKSFESLSEDVRNIFTEPINLIHFCEMRKHFPEEISSWKTSGDVAPSKLRLYRKLIQNKLAASIDTDLGVLVDDMFALVGAEALQLLRENVVTFSEAELLAIKQRCHVELKGGGEVDHAVVLSEVLKEHKPFGLNSSSRYEFKHKSEQEMFAGHYIVQRIIGGSADPLNSILGVPTEEMTRLREVLLYVVAALSRDSPRHLTQRWGELKEALREAGVTGVRDVMDCVARCPDAGILGDLVGGERWNVVEGRNVAVVPILLRHGRPSRVMVDIEAAALRREPWRALVAAAWGVEVRLTLRPLDDYEPHDDLLLPLLNSGVRLVEFSGCVGTCAGTATLTSVARDAVLYIRMAAPLDLSALGGTYEFLGESFPARGAAPLVPCVHAPPPAPWPPLPHVAAAPLPPAMADRGGGR
ncbi:uncharacterized protein LOC125177697 [Hyalella azteca]|uniref:Uncharacterized protein LOC125177697 n=1 Tax=Hyalella azteca TaxID=294128 RepID=A0A979FG40_HYAAZ|nr:uncharacterized protein LOC125177697 [Hyalella azteca]